MYSLDEVKDFLSPKGHLTMDDIRMVNDRIEDAVRTNLNAASFRLPRHKEFDMRRHFSKYGWGGRYTEDVSDGEVVFTVYLTERNTPAPFGF